MSHAEAVLAAISTLEKQKEERIQEIAREKKERTDALRLAARRKKVDEERRTYYGVMYEPLYYHVRGKQFRENYFRAVDLRYVRGPSGENVCVFKTLKIKEAVQVARKNMKWRWDDSFNVYRDLLKVSEEKKK
jgi:hypothetical protein